MLRAILRLVNLGRILLPAAAGAAVFSVAAVARPLGAQTSGPAAHNRAAARRADADRLYFDLRPQDALNTYREMLEDVPRDFETLWRAARAALSVGWLEPYEPVSVDWYRQAEEYARRAVRAAAARPEGHFWLAAALGRRAQVTRNVSTASRLADEVYREANLVLRLDPRHAGARNVLGQLHYEVLSTPWVLRQLGLNLVGGGLAFKPSWTEAERLLKEAAALDATVILYRVELARLYLRTRRPELAVPELQVALRLPPRHPPDPLFKSDAQAMLESIR